MKQGKPTPTEKFTASLPGWWAVHGQMVLRLAVALMFVLALGWLAYQFWRLLWAADPIWHSSPRGAVDLRLRYEEVRSWFSGQPLYGVRRSAVYPPASQVMLWPLLGWLPWTPARLLWAITTVVALAWLTHVLVQESGAVTRPERTFVALLPLAIYATGAAIGNGQLTVHVLVLLLGGLLLLHHEPQGGGYTLRAAILLLLALVKPSLVVPFFWMVWFQPRRWQVGLWVAAGYLGLTLFAARFQQGSAVELVGQWAQLSAAGPIGRGDVSLHALLEVLDRAAWKLPASLLLFLILGLWVYRHRRADVWLVAGVTAIATRFWTYHRWYDDMLLLLPMLALFRVAKRGPHAGGRDVLAAVLLATMWLFTLAPGGLYLLPTPWDGAYVAAQVLVWAAVLAFLLQQARCESGVSGVGDCSG